MTANTGNWTRRNSAGASSRRGNGYGSAEHEQDIKDIRPHDIADGQPSVSLFRRTIVVLISGTLVPKATMVEAITEFGMPAVSP
jgi:hypothetical protein